MESLSALVRAYGPLYFLAVWIVLGTARRLVPRSLQAHPRARAILSVAATSIAAGILVGMLGQASYYAQLHSFGDQVEPSIAAVTAMFWRGAPLYPEFGAAEAYIQVGYGPMLYVINGAFLGPLVGSVPLTKAAGPVALLLALVFMWASISPRRVGLWMAALLASALAHFAHMGYWNRPDPHLVWLSAMGVFALSLGVRRAPAAAVLLAVSMGIAVDLKFTAVLYFAPLLVRLAMEHGLRRVVAVVAGAAVVGALPFALPNVSLANYLEAIALVGRQRIATEMLIENLETALFYSFPLVLVLSFAQKEKLDRAPSRSAYGWATLGCAGVLGVVASKEGASAHHYMPLFPVLIDATVRSFRAARVVPRFVSLGLVAWAISALVVALWAQSEMRTSMLQMAQIEADVGRDLESIVARCRTVQMGYGGYRTYPLTLYRVPLVLDGNPYWLDPVTLIDRGTVGLAVPEATVDAVRSCRSQCFVVPRGDPPFSMRNPYRPDEGLFSSAFVDAFGVAYERAASSRYYDLWRCRRRRNPGEKQS